MMRSAQPRMRGAWFCRFETAKPEPLQGVVKGPHGPYVFDSGKEAAAFASRMSHRYGNGRPDLLFWAEYIED